MKCSVFVATLACVLSAALASNDYKVDQAHSEVMSYVQESMGGVRMMRGSASHLMCYDDFLPLINRLANEAKENSQECVNTADRDKGIAIDSLKKSRVELALQVKRIQDSLTACTQNADGLGYFECLSSIVDEDKKILDDIGARSKALISRYGDEIRGIDEAEQTCLRNAVESAKKKTDKAFEGLTSCIEFGPTSTEPSTVSTRNPTVDDWISPSSSSDWE